MRIVADTNIVVSGLLWNGNPRRILDAARDGIIDLITSPVLLAELREVLSRDRFAKRLVAANTTAHGLVNDFAALSKIIDAGSVEPVVARDPDDDFVISCAVSGGCEFLVSGDDDLLVLKQYGSVRILTATELISELHL